MSLALTGRLKVQFSNNSYITFNDDITVHYINFNGYYDDLMSAIEQMIKCVKNHKIDFDKLKWSYENIKKLKENK